MQSSKKTFLVGDWLVSPLDGLLTRADEVEHLEPKTMEVLVYLAGRSGDVVTREELERDVWRGAVVGYDAVTATILKLRKAMRDDARQPRIIATIPKRGYKLVASVSSENKDDTVPPIEENGVTLAGVGERSDNVQPPLSVSKNNQKYLGLIVLALTLMAGLVWYASTSSFFSAPSKETPVTAKIPSGPSIVVLPFENLGGHSKDDLLADGITEDIITDLSKLSNLLVIASFTSSQYKNTKLQPVKIGKELNVKYLLKGSIRRLGEAIRVNAELIDVKTGYNAWAQRYDRNVSEVFAVQDDVTRRIVDALAIKMTVREEQRLTHRATSNLKAYDLFQEGQRLFKIRTREANQQAIEMYRRAIEVDPGYGRAYGAIAVAMVSGYRDGWTDSPAETLDRALELAKKAVDLDGVTPQPHFALSFVYLFRRDFERALQASRVSIEIAPNYADGISMLALIHAWMGNAQQAIDLTEKALRLNPYYTAEYLIQPGIAYYTLREYESAINYLEEAYDRNPNHQVITLFLAASYINVGRSDDAQWLIAQLQMQLPNTKISELDKSLPLEKSEVKQRLFDDLRKAGVPK